MRKINSTNYENQKRHEDNCGLTYAMALLTGRWKINVLWAIYNDVNRYGLIRKRIPGLSEKMLSQRLKELEEIGLIIRKDFKKIPPHVEYSLTKAGQELIPVFIKLHKWGDEVRPFTQTLSPN